MVQANTPGSRSSGGQNSIFTGFVVASSGIPKGDREAIFGGVLAFGGEWRKELTNDVTHLVVLEPTGADYARAIQDPQKKVKVILPHFFDDCFKIRRLCPEFPYLFPDPPLLSAHHDPFIPPHVESRGDHTFLDGKVICLSSDLKLPENAIRICEEKIQEAGGQCVHNLTKKTSILICRYRHGVQFDKARERGILIGTLNWLSEMFTLSQLSEPSDKILNYPCSHKLIEAMTKCVVSISGYTGKSRDDLKQMLVLMGATYTGHLSPENTHLIAVAKEGAKYEKAVEWGIKIVNHFWIEDSFQKWIQEPDDRPCYLHFPHAPLMEMVGNSKAMATYPQDEVLSDTPPRTPPNQGQDSKKKRIRISDVEEVLNEEEFSVGRVRPKRTAAFAAENALLKLTEATKKLEKDLLKDLENASAKLDKEDKSYTPSSSHIRLHDSSIMRSPLEEVQGKINDCDEEEVVEDELGLPTQPQIKPVPKSKQKSIFISFTGIKPTPIELENIITLGGVVVEDVEDCTHLVASKIVRTEKFLCALSSCKIIVTKSWLDESLRLKKFLDFGRFVLKDKEAEEKYQFKLVTSLQRAKFQKLLKGKVIVATPNIKPDPSILQRIIECAGGRLMLKITLKRAKELGENMIAVSCPNDVASLPVSSPLRNFPIYSVEFLLTGLLRQEIPFDKDEYLLSLGS